MADRAHWFFAFCLGVYPAGAMANDATLPSALHCLALNVYHEARGEPERAQAAVAHVVLNRVASRRFPPTVCEVVRQGGERRKFRCQFSWFCDGRSDRPFERRAWAKATTIAARALLGFSSDPTGGALWYHAHRVNPRWANRMTVSHADRAHIFYRP